METLAYLSVLAVMLPIYFGWLACLAAVAIAAVGWIFLIMALCLCLVIGQGGRITVALRSELISWREELLVARLKSRLSQQLNSFGAAECCACVGGTGAARRAVVHIRSGENSWSYVQTGSSDHEALLRVYGKHLAAGTLRVPGSCRHDCPIASECPNRTASRSFQEIFRFTIPALRVVA